jgi:hypothetical protein
MLDPQIVVVQRWMHKDAPAAIRAAIGAGQVVIQDVDDWFWGLHKANQAYRITDPRTNPTVNREHYRRAVLASTLTTCSTEFLAKRIRERIGARTVVLRNALDLPMFGPAEYRDVSEGLVVGWVGALAWRSGDLETLRGVLGPFLEGCDGSFVHHGVSAKDRVTAGELAGVPAARWGPSQGMLPPERYPELLDGFDIGLVPLSAHEFNRAKSGIKGLEMGASGIPFVAARTPEYERLGFGLLASTPGEWRDALERLRDPVERLMQRELGLTVARSHAIQVRWREWEDVYAAELARVLATAGV